MKAILNFIGNVLEAGKSWIPVITAIAFLFLAASFTSCTSELPGVEAKESVELSTRNSEDCQYFFNSMGDITEHYGYFYTWFDFGSTKIDGLCYLVAMYENGPVIYKIFTDGQYTHGFTGYLCDVKLYYLYVKTGPGAYTEAQAGQFAQMLKKGQSIPENENILLCDYVYHCEPSDHVPADSVKITPIDNYEAKSDPITFKNYDCLSIYDGINQFTIENQIDGGHVYYIIKFPNGETGIIYTDGYNFVNVGTSICGVQITRFWASEESYTLAESWSMAQDIASGAQVERPDTESCTVIGECTPDALTENE